MAVAHGSRDPRASATVEALLERVRRARPGLAVHPAYLDHARPTLREALTPLDRAVVLPLLLTEAYHSRVDIPAALREERARRAAPPGDPAHRPSSGAWGPGGHEERGDGVRRPPLLVHQGAALGPHPLLVAALERRLAEAGVEIGDPGTAVVLVSAGSSDAGANAVVAAMARDWAHARRWHSVTPAYASAASPTPEEAVRGLLGDGPGRPSRVVVAPYLLAPGYFADKVRRTTLAAGAQVVAAPLGAAPELVEVLLERHAEAVAAFRRLTPPVPRLVPGPQARSR
ncbi:sirohydrochlorin chelatase [Sphaerisporangium melleum]|uniref:Sirohydrochlorin chelatase n=1 Tax=Sphaerisporangium melleum TaxID=321316 RepID=A0A917QWP3_9ACTN|nr:sirohydrochlorin chelatase [Sphaerisporangium melleum]GGK72267.1 sirohydrochlorin chelatase [Sphaerisporangium melleum]GII68362.1 sirohydrochlorin chelatase [Sphaerisporangium melleum]